MWRRKINPFVVVRILIGIVFIVSSSEKLIGPYQNFLYVIQNYQLLPAFLENAVARLFPWIELFVGVFLLLGLWLKLVLRAALVLLMIFIVVVAQALIRHLDITECGCFGGLVSVPPVKVMIFDSILLSFTALLLFRFQRTSVFSLDQYFERTK